MGYHRSGIYPAGAHQRQGLVKVVEVAARIAGDVGVIIVNIVIVEFGREGGVGRTGKEVEASVVTENGARLLYNGLHGSVNKYVVKALAVGKIAQCLYRIVTFTGVYIVKINAEFLCVLRRIDFAARASLVSSTSVITSIEGWRSQ